MYVCMILCSSTGSGFGVFRFTARRLPRSLVLRPIFVLRFRISEGLTQAES